jgi:hypothetical protein
MITIEQCKCPYENCRDWWLVGAGHFVQGSGFTKEQAAWIAALLNVFSIPEGSCITYTQQIAPAVMAEYRKQFATSSKGAP